MSGPGWHRHRPPAIDGGAGSDTTAHVQPIAGQSRLILVMINPLTVAVYDQDVGCYLSSGFIHTDQGNQSDNILFLTLHLSSNPFRVCFHSSVSLSHPRWSSATDLIIFMLPIAAALSFFPFLLRLFFVEIFVHFVRPLISLCCLHVRVFVLSLAHLFRFFRIQSLHCSKKLIK